MLLNCSIGEDSWESLDYKEIQPVHPKGDQSWVFIGRTDAEAEAPILWQRDVKSWLTGKDPDSGNDWRWEEKGTTEDEMVGWHHQLDGHEFEQAPGVGDGQGSLAYCSPWGRKELDTTELNLWPRNGQELPPLTKSMSTGPQQTSRWMWEMEYSPLRSGARPSHIPAPLQFGTALKACPGHNGRGNNRQRHRKGQNKALLIADNRTIMQKVPRNVGERGNSSKSDWA